MCPTFEVTNGQKGEIAEIYLQYSSIEKSPWVAMHGVPGHWAAGGVIPFATQELVLKWLKENNIEVGIQLSEEPVKVFGSYCFGDSIKES